MKSMTVFVTYENICFEVRGSYTQGSTATMYRSNGDPGDPKKPDEFDVECVPMTAGQDDDLSPVLSEKVFGDIRNLAVEAAREQLGDDARDMDEQEDASL